MPRRKQETKDPSPEPVLKPLFPEVSAPAPVVPVPAGDGTIRGELIRLVRLPLSEAVDREITGTMTGAEALARVLLRRAVMFENQGAIDAILDRIEGKPTRAALNLSSNDHITDQLDRFDDLAGFVENESEE